jgi:hypothetical protein
VRLRSQVERIHTDLLELMPEQIVDVFVLAWHHDHLFYQSHGKKKHYHRRESEFWLNFSEGLLDDQFDAIKALGKRSGSQNVALAILPGAIVPCRYGYAPLFAPGTLGTHPT